MANKDKTLPSIKDRGVLQIPVKEGESMNRAMARAMATPEMQAALTIRQWQDPVMPDTIDLNDTIIELREQSKAIKSGKMRRAEEMLLAQAHTLDELFNNLARKAHRQEYLSNYETFFKLALKAQNQCRMTLETLSKIKNPPVVYAKQANITNGPQQINNGLPLPEGSTHAEKIQNQPNELLDVQHGKQLDTGTTGKTIGGDKAMAAVD